MNFEKKAVGERADSNIQSQYNVVKCDLHKFKRIVCLKNAHATYITYCFAEIIAFDDNNIA